MKKILFLILILCSKEIIFAQTDSSLLKILNKPILNCEVIAYNSQSLLPKFDFKNTDSIYQILKIWESVCGENERQKRRQNSFFKIFCWNAILTYQN